MSEPVRSSSDSGSHREANVDTTDSHLLVADEDAEVCGQNCEYLGRHDFRVTSVNTRKRLLEIIACEPIDLLLLEPRLSGGDGIGLTRSVRESSMLPIVMLSGLTEEADRVMGLELGAVVFVLLSFLFFELLARFRVVL